jgi:predicted nicotinamide N-methyase
MSELDLLLEQIGSKYEVETVPFKIGDKVLKLLQLKNYEDLLVDLVEKETPLLELPFWAKVWEASSLLAYFLGKQPVVLGQRILEIGAGIGVVGIYASLCGHRVTVTDINEDALLFARANALLNGVTQIDIRKLDWNDQVLPEPYDLIVGSEVIYDRRCYALLVDFLHRALTPTGIVFLAKHVDLKAPTFFTELIKFFEFKQTVQTITVDGESQQIGLYAIRRKHAA